jgi:hypothetical protein
MKIREGIYDSYYNLCLFKGRMLHEKAKGITGAGYLLGTKNSRSKHFLGMLRGISWITGKTAKPKDLI